MWLHRQMPFMAQVGTVGAGLARTLVLCGGVAFAGAQLASAQTPLPWPTQGWPVATPEEQGFDSAQLAGGVRDIRQRGLDIHSLLLVRNGAVVLDASFYPYDGTTVHEVASVTKSVMTTLIGIAVDQGRLQLDAPLLSFFPNRTVANRDARKESVTVRHLATMSSGLECTAANDEQTLKDMRISPDWVQFTLDRKVVWEPGTHFEYCSPAMHLLSAVLQRASGMTALAFAQANLFGPLGIRDVRWLTDPQGLSRGSEGLYLRPHDLAKLGYLWLNEGVWDGRQVVSRAWVEESVRVQMTTGGEDEYGYGWWIATDEPAAYNAIGRGGQRIIVVPHLNLIIVTTGGGFSFADIEPFLRATLAHMNSPLPANPAGVASLKAAVGAAAQPPAPTAVPPLPATARAISGKTMVFGTNSSGWETFRLVFTDPAEATLDIKVSGSDQATWPVALDGVYRLFPGQFGLPMGLRGRWLDDQTFAIEYDNIANNDHVMLRMRFDGDRVSVHAQETDHEGSTTVEGRLVPAP